MSLDWREVNTYNLNIIKKFAGCEKMYDKSDSWLEIADKVKARSEAISREIGAKSAIKTAGIEAAEALGRSEVLVRRYLIAERSLSALLPLVPNVTRENFHDLAFSTAEFIGRMRSLDEDMAAEWLGKAVGGNVKVVEARAAYEELAAAFNAKKAALGETQGKIGKRSDQKSSSSQHLREHNRLVDFKDGAAQAAHKLFGENHSDSIETDDPIALDGVLETGPIFKWEEIGTPKFGTFVALPPYVFENEQVFRARMGRIGFSSLYFHEYWLIIEPLSSAIDSMSFVRFVERLDLPSVGIAMLDPADGELKIIMTPNASFTPRAFP